MNQLNRDVRDLHPLFEALLEGTLSPEQTKELDTLLIRDAAARRRYIQYVQLHVSLAANAAAPGAGGSCPPLPAGPTIAAAQVISPTAGVSQQPPAAPTAPPAIAPPLGLTGGGFPQGALLVLLILGVFGGGASLGVYYRGSATESDNPSHQFVALPADQSPHAAKLRQSDVVIPVRAEPGAGEIMLSPSIPFATMVKVAGCRWGACTLPTQTGSRLTAGLLRLDSGKAQITFDNGARLYLQGPAVLYLHSPSRTHLQSGKLVANVPEQAIGFTIETQKAEIVDLGTEFGVDVAASGETEVQVLDGEVEVGVARGTDDPQQWLQEPAAPQPDEVAGTRQRLEVGEARRISNAAGDWQPVAFTPDVFRLLRPTLRSTPESPWRRILSDDFDDNYLDPDKWRIRTDGSTAGAPQIREVDGRIMIVDRARLVTVNQMDPVRLAGLRITGQWTFQTPEDMFEVVLRTDGAGGDSEGGGPSGVHFAARMERTTSHIGIFGSGHMASVQAAYGDILINPGDVFNFEILDVPGGMSLRLREASGSGAEAHVHTLPAEGSPTNFVMFSNGARRKSAHVAFVDNIICEQGNGNVRMNADGLIEIKQ